MDKYAKIIWDYMLVKHPLKKCEVIFVLCSIDDRVAEYAAKLYLDGYGDLLIFSGGVAHQGDLLKVSWDASEAEHFADIAQKAGVPRDKILTETKATNTGENITLTYELMQLHDLKPTSILLVQKPYMERRTYATIIKQWPGEKVDFVVTSPPLAYNDYFNKQNIKEDIINIMVGDLQRIKEYPALGYQIEQMIPDDVWVAYNQLVKMGYTKHLMN